MTPRRRAAAAPATKLRPTTVDAARGRAAGNGSALISCGETRVICTASVQGSVPRWLSGRGRGWVTAETQACSPASTSKREQRDVPPREGLDGPHRRDPAPDQPLAPRRRSTSRRWESGRIYIGCDVLQANSRIRCASITGGPVGARAGLQRAGRRGQAPAAAAPNDSVTPRCSCVPHGRRLRCSTSTIPRTPRQKMNAQRRDDGGGRPGSVQRGRRPPAHAALARAPRRPARAPGAAGHRGAARDSGRPAAHRCGAAACAPPRATARRSSGEFERLLPDLGVDLLPDDVEAPPEDDNTYAANALIKARAAAAATGRATVADNSGIEAAALGGASRRAQRALRRPATRPTATNLAKLAAEAAPGTGLRYVCVIAHVTRGRRASTCSRAPAKARSPPSRAASGGFGYDPAVRRRRRRDGRTMAELSDAEKDAISHRGRAARELARWLTRR